MRTVKSNVETRWLRDMATVFCAAAAVMLVFEATKELVFWEGLSPWESHTITIMVTAMIATGLGIVVRRRTVRLTDEIKATELRAANFKDTLLNALPVAVFYKDREGRYLGCNHVFSEILGVTEERIRGKTVHELWPGELAETYHRKDLKLMEHPETQQYEFRIKDRQGQIRDVIYGKGVFLDADGAVAGIVGTFFDVTDRNEAERQLSEYRRHLEELVDRRTRELKRAYEELRQFAFAAAHDLQEPLRQIVTYTQMLQKQLGPDPDAEKRQAIDYAVGAAKLMRTRIGDIKSFLDEMETARARQEVDIAALVKAVVEEFAETASKRMTLPRKNGHRFTRLEARPGSG